MQDNFDLKQYLRHGNKLLNENIGGYVDLKPINRLSELNDFGMTQEDTDSMSLEELMGKAVKMDELEKPENIYADDTDRYDNNDRIFDLGGERIEQGIISLLDDGFEPEDILDFVKIILEDQVQAAVKGKKF